MLSAEAEVAGERELIHEFPGDHASSVLTVIYCSFEVKQEQAMRIVQISTPGPDVGYRSDSLKLSAVTACLLYHYSLPMNLVP